MADSLVGSWDLESFELIDSSGNVSAGPLGPNPVGRLLYLPDGHVSVSMAAGTGDRRFMGYAGYWRLVSDTLILRIVVASRPDWVGTEQVRHIDVSRARLRVAVSRSELAGGAGRVLHWVRAPACGSSTPLQEDSTCLSSTEKSR